MIVKTKDPQKFIEDMTEYLNGITREDIMNMKVKDMIEFKLQMKLLSQGVDTLSAITDRSIDERHKRC